MAQKALEGVRVLELCELVAGPFCARLLADFGAEVWKIEKPGVGDEARRVGPFPQDIPDPEKSGLFLYANINKLGLTLDVSSATGRKYFKELVKRVDVLVEDQPPGKMRRWRLDFARLRKINPGLVMASITPFGQTGPYKDYVSYPLNTFHAGGEGYYTAGGGKNPDRAPVKHGNYVGEYQSGLTTAVAIMGGLHLREKTGSGCYLDISKQQALVHFNAYELGRYPNTGFLTTRFTRYYPLGGPKQCKDGYVLLSPGSEDRWQALVDWMGNPDWAKEKPLSYWRSSPERIAEVERHMRSWLMERTKDELYYEGQAQGVLLAPYYDVGEATHSRQFKARGFLVEVDHPRAGTLQYPFVPYRLPESPALINRPAPLLGQDNEEVYRKHLGLTPSELCLLARRGVI